MLRVVCWIGLSTIVRVTYARPSWKRKTDSDEVDGGGGVVEAIDEEVRILVHREHREQGVPGSTAEFGYSDRSVLLFASAEIGMPDGAEGLTLGATAAASGSNSFFNHARSLKKESFLAR